ncbi:MAG: radical SAM protein [Polyangiaceae bacterium]|nr:radical SAM protein [Polyangiaceae bacterium]
MQALDPLRLYRLPWTLTDNPIAWLEPTMQCNLACDGCYRQNVKEHKPIEEVQAELDCFARLRNFDGVSIAGGDPLMHPEVVEIVRRVAKMGRKPIINTNGLDLRYELLCELKAAGLVGLTFHVDSHQGRPGWRNKTEREMNELRSEYVELVARVGGLACAFNSTVYDDTLDQVPDVVAWGRENIDRVNTVVFITYRAAIADGFDYFVGGRKAEMQKLVYTIDQPRRTDITARDVARLIREAEPDYEPCAYLGGTVDPQSFKWLLAMRIGTQRRTHGWMGARMMEATQVIHHMTTGRYMSYAPPASLEAGRSLMLGGSLFDRGVRQAAARWARSFLSDPRDALATQRLQAVVVIQPIDLMQDGRDNMCDGCPDMTLHEGKLVWSCRLEELRQFGQLASAAPKRACRQLDASAELGARDASELSSA